MKKPNNKLGAAGKVKPKGAKRPCAIAFRGIVIDHLRADMDSHYAVLPLPARQARELVRFANMTPAEQVEALGEVIHSTEGYPASRTWRAERDSRKEAYRVYARATLQRLGLGEGAKTK